MNVGDRSLRLALATLAGVFSLIASASTGAGQTVTLGLPADHDPYGTPFYVGEEKGYFGDIKIDYKIIKGGSEVLKQVANGSLDIGFAQPTEVMIRFSTQGKELPPVKYFYMLETSSGNQMAVPVASPIKKVEDMKGKTIGISSQTASNVQLFKGILRLHGINPDTEVTWLAVGHGGPHVQALRNGTIDVSGTQVTRHAAYDFLGAKLRPIHEPRADSLFGNGLFASNQTLADQEKSKVLVKIAQGVSKAVQYCEKNANECVDILVKRFPQFLPSGMGQQEGLQYLRTQFAARMASLKERNDQEGVPGLFSEKAWKDFVAFMRVSEGLQGNPDTSSIYTNAIVTRAFKEGASR